MPDFQLVPVDHDPFTAAPSDDAALAASMTHWPQTSPQPYMHPNVPIAAETIEQYLHGGLPEVLQNRGVQVPEWVNRTNEFLHREDVNIAMGMASPLKGAKIADVLPRVPRRSYDPNRPINPETLREMSEAAATEPEPTFPGRQINEQTLEELREFAEKNDNSRASRTARMYNPPAKFPRSFEEDYPQGVGEDVFSLSKDIEGRPLSAPRVAGKSVVGGKDEAIRPEDFDAITQAATGTPGRDVLASELPKSGGRTVVGSTRIDQFSGRPLGIKLYRNLSAADRQKVYGHEIGHAIDQLAGGMPMGDLKAELRTIYNDLNNPDLAQARRYNPDVNPSSRPILQNWGPEKHGYKGADVEDELRAEAVRAYMADPNYIKTVAPNVAKRIRQYANPNSDISKFLQFNALPIGVGLGAGINLIPVDHDPFASQ